VALWSPVAACGDRLGSLIGPRLALTLLKAAFSLITARQNATGALAGFDALPSSLLKTNPG